MTAPYEALSEAVEAARTLLLTAPDRLDGDAIGALLGLHRAIKTRWPEKSVRIVVEEVVPERYCFLEGSETLFEQGTAVIERADLAIVVDGDPGRLGTAEPHFTAAVKTGQVDHHKSSDPEAVDFAYLDSKAASTTEMILTLCDHWGVGLDRPLAEALYTGIIFDTNTFRYRMTRPATLRAAARMMEAGIDHATLVEHVLMVQPLSKVKLRARMLDKMEIFAEGQAAWARLDAEEIDGAETGGLVDDLLFIEGVDLAILAIVRDADTVKLSLRSRGSVDCCALAQRMSPRGGGHTRAAGATVKGPVEETMTRLLQEAPTILS
ncbi:MAG: DHH family phosphoesterase [Bradymonadia bacterium]